MNTGCFDKGHFNIGQYGGNTIVTSVVGRDMGSEATAIHQNYVSKLFVNDFNILVRYKRDRTRNLLATFILYYIRQCFLLSR